MIEFDILIILGEVVCAFNRSMFKFCEWKENVSSVTEEPCPDLFGNNNKNDKRERKGNKNIDIARK
jgi:hypothetical protein